MPDVLARRQNLHHRAARNRNVLMIRKLKSDGYRLYSRKKNPKTGKRRNLAPFKTRAAAKKHEKSVQYFKKPIRENGLHAQRRPQDND
jgi:hypothetical protein